MFWNLLAIASLIAAAIAILLVRNLSIRVSTLELETEAERVDRTSTLEKLKSTHAAMLAMSRSRNIQ